ncbi:hypothetical protein RI367_007935 [Sorochytrium milnesiophthora]
MKLAAAGGSISDPAAAAPHHFEGARTTGDHLSACREWAARLPQPRLPLPASATPVDGLLNDYEATGDEVVLQAVATEIETVYLQIQRQVAAQLTQMHPDERARLRRERRRRHAGPAGDILQAPIGHDGGND